MPTVPSPRHHLGSAAAAAAAPPPPGAPDAQCHLFGRKAARRADAAGGLNLLGVHLGLSAPVSAAVFLYAFGSVFGYSLDILFAKRDFQLPGVPAEAAPVALPYTALGPRTRWLLRSFASKQFYRFLITVLIDTLIGLALLKATLDFLDRRRVLASFKYRDSLVAIAVAVFTFFLYTNILRFDWAYRDGDDPMMNLVVLMWSTLVLMLFALSYRQRGGDEAAPDGQGSGGGAAVAVPLRAA